MPEQCENCGAAIGKLETAYLLDEHVLCEPCHQKLSKRAKADEKAQSDRENSQTENQCPECSNVVSFSQSKCPSCGHDFGLRCPYCGTPGTASYSMGVILGCILFFPLGLVLLLMPKTASCENCGKSYSAPGMKLA